MADNLNTRAVEIMKQCPRFDRCSVPVCPLDLDQEHRIRLPGEPKCRLGKSARFRIGQNTNLQFQGLTKREWSARQHWQALSEAERQRKTAHLRQISPICTGFSDREGKIGNRIPPDEKTTDNSTEVQP